MPQPKFNKISIGVSRYIGDEVSSANQNGRTFSANDRLEAINRARGLLYEKKLELLGIKEFMRLYPEFIKFAEAISLNPKPDDVKKIIKLEGVPIVEAVPEEHYLDSRDDQFSKWYSSEVKRRFYEYADKVEIIGAEPQPEDIGAHYLAQPVDVSIDGDDIMEPNYWIESIISIATKILLNTQQITI